MPPLPLRTSTVSLLLAAASCSTPGDERSETLPDPAVPIQYLEIVSPEVDTTCDLLGDVHGVSFGAPEASFGNARIASLRGGGMIGVRAPMRATEQPVVRPYLLVEDIETAVQAAESAGATIALPPMEMPGHGQFAIYLLGGIEHGLWQL